MTDDFFSPPAPPWERYIAIGDSFTEGLWDAPTDPDTVHGWADRLAQSLSERRLEATRQPLAYANLAVRGRLLEPILRDQLPLALEADPDLISIVGGGNDVLRPGADPDVLAARLERSVRAVRQRGIDVLLATSMDTRGAGPLLSSIRPKMAVFNAHLWSIARRTGSRVLDVWGLQALRDWRMWAPDRIHLSTLGHQRVSQAALVALDLEPDDPQWSIPLSAQSERSRSAQLREDAQWLRRDVYPWATRRFRRTSSGDVRVAKRQTLTPVDGPLIESPAEDRATED